LQVLVSPLGTQNHITGLVLDPSNGYAMWYAADGTIQQMEPGFKKYTLVVAVLQLRL